MKRFGVMSERWKGFGVISVRCKKLGITSWGVERVWGDFWEVKEIEDNFCLGRGVEEWFPGCKGFRVMILEGLGWCLRTYRQTFNKSRERNKKFHLFPLFTPYSAPFTARPRTPLRAQLILERFNCFKLHACSSEFALLRRDTNNGKKCLVKNTFSLSGFKFQSIASRTWRGVKRNINWLSRVPKSFKHFGNTTLSWPTLRRGEKTWR